jgi:proteic killer suppression protein
MIKSFGNKLTEHLFHGISSKEVRGFPSSLIEITARKLDLLNAVLKLDDLRAPPSNQLKKLHGDLNDYYSIRINNQFRIIFVWNEGDVEQVKVVDYH